METESQTLYIRAKIRRTQIIRRRIQALESRWKRLDLSMGKIRQCSNSRRLWVEVAATIVRHNLSLFQASTLQLKLQTTLEDRRTRTLQERNNSKDFIPHQFKSHQASLELDLYYRDLRYAKLTMMTSQVAEILMGTATLVTLAHRWANL